MAIIDHAHLLRNFPAYPFRGVISPACHSADARRGWCNYSKTTTQSTMEIDADRDRAVKDVLDAVAYEVRLFRDFNEPTEGFTARLKLRLAELALALPQEGGLL